MKSRRLLDDLDIEGERAETVIAADHGAHGILHPAIVEIAFSVGQGFHELPHGGPCRGAHARGAFAVHGDPLLALPYVARMGDGVLVPGHQIRIDRLPDCRDSYLVFHDRLSIKGIRGLLRLRDALILGRV